MCNTLPHVCRFTFTHFALLARNFSRSEVKFSGLHARTHTFLSWPSSRWQHNTDARHWRLQAGNEVALHCITPGACFSKSNPSTSGVRSVKMCKNTVRGKHPGLRCAPTFRRPRILTPLCAFFAQIACKHIMGRSCPTTLLSLLSSNGYWLNLALVFCSNIFGWLILVHYVKETSRKIRICPW